MRYNKALLQSTQFSGHSQFSWQAHAATSVTKQSSEQTPKAKNCISTARTALAKRLSGSTSALPSNTFWKESKTSHIKNHLPCNNTHSKTSPIKDHVPCNNILSETDTFPFHVLSLSYPCVPCPVPINPRSLKHWKAYISGLQLWKDDAGIQARRQASTYLWGATTYP